MKLSLMQHEFNLMMNSKKNILFIFFLFVGICSYIFIILPNEETIETFDADQTFVDVEELYHTQKAREARRGTGFSSFTGRNYFADNNYNYQLQKGMLHAFEESDFQRFVSLRTHYLYSVRVDLLRDDTFFQDSPFPTKDRMHYIDKQLLTYEQLLNIETPITYSMIEEKTALQVFKNILLSFGPFLIILSAIYFSNDVLVRDRRQTTTLQGLPVSWYQLINIKTFVAFFYTILILFGLLLVGLALLAMTNGFGSFQMIVPVFEGRIDGLHFGYEVISMLKFFIQVLVIAPIVMFMFIRLNMMLSLLFRNEWAVLLLSMFALASERFYYSRETRELFGVNISNFPQTYFDFGKIVTGEKNYLVNLETITYVKGLTVLLITFVVVEIAVFTLTRIINRRRFYNV